MSASLVGSEMCIRDSLKSTTATCELSLMSLSTVPFRSESTEIRPAPCWNCLLYTSDAADDM
eukprot:9766694-Alexandrium_andersonii.AAC.1